MLSKKNLEVMQSFTVKDIPNLDVCVLGALEFLSGKKLPKIDIGNSKRILVIGSGNALVAGRIIFEDRDAVFASESDYKMKLKVARYDLVVLISSSGGKHAVGIAKYLKTKKNKILLLTNNIEAPAGKFVGEKIVFPKQREPYTYNTSTYLSMILSATGESVEKIYEEIKKLDKKIPDRISHYDSFYFILPSKMDAVRELFVTKFDELFGSEVGERVFTDEQTKHAKTVVPSGSELFVGLGLKNTDFGKKRFNVELPRGFSYGMIMSVGYYLVGKIQKGKTPFFKKNIVKYTEEASRIFGEKIEPIVDGDFDL